MALGVDLPILIDEIKDIEVLKGGTVYRLKGVSGSSVVVKFEYAAPDSFKLHKKFVNVVDPANLKIRRVNDLEIQAMDVALMRRPTSPLFQKTIREKLGEPEFDRLQIQFGKVRSGEIVAIKMPDFGKVSTMEMPKNTATPTKKERKIWDRKQTLFFGVYFKDYHTAKKAWKKLGRIAAMDLFLGNLDRFSPEAPEEHFQVIRNLGNHMLVGNLPVGLDTWDPASDFKLLEQPLKQKNPPWAGNILNPRNPEELAKFAKQVVADYTLLSGHGSWINRQERQRWGEWFIKGLEAERSQILQKMVRIRLSKGSLPSGLAEREQILQGI